MSSKMTPGGRKLRELRECAKRTQLSIEIQAGIGTGYLQRVESGKVLHPEKETLERILKALDVSYGGQRQVLEMFGYTAPTPLPNEDEIAWATRVSQSDLHSLAFPACLLDCSLRLLDWNHSVPKILGFPSSSMQMSRLKYLPITKLIFDEQYYITQRIINPETFFLTVLRVLLIRMQPFRHEEWYANIISEPYERLPLFKEHWNKVMQDEHSDTIACPCLPVRFDAHHGGELQFHLFFENFIPDSRFHFVYCLPADTATMNYCTMCA